MSTRFTIARLGAQGDGIADTESGPVFVPFALPGETVTAARQKDRATLISVIEPSADRVLPPCRHFGECGGCAAQHMREDFYRDWKRDKVVQALRAKGIGADLVAPLVPCMPGSRRRAVFSARRTEKGMLVGYNQHASHVIVDVEQCPILLSPLATFVSRLRDLAAAVCATSQAFHVTVTVTDSGLDVAFAGSGALSAQRRAAAVTHILGSAGHSPPIARLSVDGEIIVEPMQPVLRFGDTTIVFPPGGFLQAVPAAEQTMAGLVETHLGRCRRVADLFAGSGAFALRLARAAEVHAVESDQTALNALDRGFRFATGLRRVTHERRDLFRRPLTAKELSGFDGLVFDPPRAGAEDQAKQIARSQVARVAAVSCNPLSLARDLRILLDGGYRLDSVTPVDQFLWSPHVEAVALLTKRR